jgi:hypothetical protein
VYSPNLRLIPKLPIQVSMQDVDQLEKAINNNPKGKEANILKVQLASV